MYSDIHHPTTNKYNLTFNTKIWIIIWSKICGTRVITLSQLNNKLAKLNILLCLKYFGDVIYERPWLAYPVLESHGLNLDDVVPAEVKRFETLQIPENCFRNWRQAISRKIENFERQSQWVEVLTFQLWDEIVWKKMI